MKIVRGVNKIKRFKSPVVALGVFDGVHRGHRKILIAASRKARSIKGTSMALTFWPHPQKEGALNSLEHRLRLIAELGIDVCVVINFNRGFAKMTAEDFVKRILFKKLGARYIYVGDNFRFGRGARGGIKTLKKLSKEYKFRLMAFKVLKVKKHPISSTYIRALIKNGDLGLAQRLLSRPVGVLGTVIKGSSIGRKLGFPTANINPHHEVIPARGVYAVKVIFDKKRLDGICNIGYKPTFKIPGRPREHIELHIFNFHKNIYGKYLEVQFIRKIREEKKFSSSAALVEQIKKDINSFRKHFPRH